MARPGTRCLLIILLVNLSKCLAPPGPPACPSLPLCQIPYEDYDRRIHCVWDPGPVPQNPTTYNLHWESNDHQGQVKGTNVSGLIRREQYCSHCDLRVWVQAENHYGSAKCPEASFNTADIMKPPRPSVTGDSQEPLQNVEIHWMSQCELEGYSEGHCEVRYRAEADPDWLKGEGEFNSYTVESPQPYTVYEFQVRCSCSDVTDLMSDWSAVHRVQSAEAPPVGELDVWRDCGISSGSFECILTWKKLPRSQARGHILGYEINLSYGNGTAVLLNTSTAEPSSQLVCDEMRCHLTASLKGVLAVSVSACSDHGATFPARLAMPTAGKRNDEQAIHLKMDSESLSVSWDLPSQLSDSLKEYVVQYKQAGLPPMQGFDWVRVNKSQTTGTLKGQFEKYTAYRVSLFAVSHNSNTRHLSSVIGYSLQGIPPKVPSFKVIAIDATHVTLSWEPIPLLQRKGVIRCYQIGVDGQVYNVSTSPQHENLTFLLERLSPGQEYDVWIMAVTEAGPGANTTTRFKTKDQEFFVFGYIIPILLATTPVVIVCIVYVAIILFRVENNACCYEKVPDPRYSHIFEHMKHQFSDPMVCICGPVVEPHLKICNLEVVESQPQAFRCCPEKTSLPDGLAEQVVGDECSQANREGDQREDAVRAEEGEWTEARRKYERDNYSKMIDSEEERDWDEALSSSEEEQARSGYEEHFMPSALDMLEV